ncbi:hypothetical protein OHB54_46345 (plasmid) [Streptomyces sp. NBC_01007]|nr:hypothetical protein OHB54_46345 [Streptomyces sp. NBC_01007]
MNGKQHGEKAKAAPFLELRVGGLHLTVQRLPYSLLAMVTGLLGSMGGAIWLGR